MCKDGKLLCSTSHCIFETDHAGFGREIEIKGFALCPNCGGKAIYPDDRFSDDNSRSTYWKCPICKQIIPNSNEKWTQIVVAKHHGKNSRKHRYSHKECDEARYVVSEDDGSETSET